MGVTSASFRLNCYTEKGIFIGLAGHITMGGRVGGRVREREELGSLLFL